MPVLLFLSYYFYYYFYLIYACPIIFTDHFETEQVITLLRNMQPDAQVILRYYL